MKILNQFGKAAAAATISKEQEDGLLVTPKFNADHETGDQVGLGQ